MIGGDGVNAPTHSAGCILHEYRIRAHDRTPSLHRSYHTTEIDEAIADIDEHIDEAFRTVDAGKARTIIGVSGTVTTMTALAMGLRNTITPWSMAID